MNSHSSEQRWKNYVCVGEIGIGEFKKRRRCFADDRSVPINKGTKVYTYQVAITGHQPGPRYVYDPFQKTMRRIIIPRFRGNVEENFYGPPPEPCEGIL